MILRDWFSYSDTDRSPYNPTTDTLVTVERWWRNESSKSSFSDWKAEEWLIQSALVPMEQLPNIVDKIVYPRDFNFEIGWKLENKFYFGESANLGEIPLSPLSLLIKNPITNDFSVELNREFIIYHALLEKEPNQYYHPKDDILVADISIDNDRISTHPARVAIHKHYLRDFLAAVKMGLIISVTADRRANAITEEELYITQLEDVRVDEFTLMSKSSYPLEVTPDILYHGRSVLRKNFIVEPYPQPRFDTNSWWFSGENSINNNDELPRFIVDSEGNNKTLAEFKKTEYLYFRPGVLHKYLKTNHYNAFFHKRNWGSASTPTGETIDIGINSQGLINTFAPDLAKLPVPEQNYWASFSSLPSGEICEDLFQTRMQSNPTHSPGVTELIQKGLLQLNNAFSGKISQVLFTDVEPNQRDQNRLSIGPIDNQNFEEVCELAKIFYQWIIEPMQIRSLREFLTSVGETWDKDWRQIKLVKQILTAKGMEETQARELTAPLAGLNELRTGAAHIGNPNLEDAFKLMGASTVPKTSRSAWILCVDSVTKCLNDIADVLQS